MSMRPWDNADQAVSIVAILLFINAAFIGAPLLDNLITLTLGTLGIIVLVFVAAAIAGGVGLLKGINSGGYRWAWPLALAAVVFDGLLNLLRLPAGIFGLLIDALILYLLFRPSVRERFGQLRQQ